MGDAAHRTAMGTPGCGAGDPGGGAPAAGAAPYEMAHVGPPGDTLTAVSLTQDDINREVRQLWDEMRKLKAPADAPDPPAAHTHDEEIRTLQVLVKGSAMRERRRALQEFSEATQSLTRELEQTHHQVRSAQNKQQTAEDNLLVVAMERDDYRKRADRLRQESCELARSNRELHHETARLAQENRDLASQVEEGAASAAAEQDARLVQMAAKHAAAVLLLKEEVARLRDRLDAQQGARVEGGGGVEAAVEVPEPAAATAAPAAVSLSLTYAQAAALEEERAQLRARVEDLLPFKKQLLPLTQAHDSLRLEHDALAGAHAELVEGQRALLASHTEATERLAALMAFGDEQGRALAAAEGNATQWQQYAQEWVSRAQEAEAQLARLCGVEARAVQLESDGVASAAEAAQLSEECAAAGAQCAELAGSLARLEDLHQKEAGRAAQLQLENAAMESRLSTLAESTVSSLADASSSRHLYWRFVHWVACVVRRRREENLKTQALRLQGQVTAVSVLRVFYVRLHRFRCRRVAFRRLCQAGAAHTLRACYAQLLAHRHAHLFVQPHLSALEEAGAQLQQRTTALACLKGRSVCAVARSTDVRRMWCAWAGLVSNMRATQQRRAAHALQQAAQATAALRDAACAEHVQVEQLQLRVAEGQQAAERQAQALQHTIEGLQTDIAVGRDALYKERVTREAAEAVVARENRLKARRLEQLTARHCMRCGWHSLAQHAETKRQTRSSITVSLKTMQCERLAAQIREMQVSALIASAEVSTLQSTVEVRAGQVAELSAAVEVATAHAGYMDMRRAVLRSHAATGLLQRQSLLLLARYYARLARTGTARLASAERAKGAHDVALLEGEVAQLQQQQDATAACLRTSGEQCEAQAKDLAHALTQLDEARVARSELAAASNELCSVTRERDDAAARLEATETALFSAESRLDDLQQQRDTACADSQQLRDSCRISALAAVPVLAARAACALLRPCFQAWRTHALQRRVLQARADAVSMMHSLRVLSLRQRYFSLWAARRSVALCRDAAPCQDDADLRGAVAAVARLELEARQKDQEAESLGAQLQASEAQHEALQAEVCSLHASMERVQQQRYAEQVDYHSRTTAESVRRRRMKQVQVCTLDMLHRFCVVQRYFAKLHVLVVLRRAAAAGHECEMLSHSVQELTARNDSLVSELDDARSRSSESAYTSQVLASSRDTLLRTVATTRRQAAVCKAAGLLEGTGLTTCRRYYEALTRHVAWAAVWREQATSAAVRQTLLDTQARSDTLQQQLHLKAQELQQAQYRTSVLVGDVQGAAKKGLRETQRARCLALRHHADQSALRAAFTALQLYPRYHVHMRHANAAEHETQQLRDQLAGSRDRRHAFSLRLVTRQTHRRRMQAAYSALRSRAASARDSRAVAVRWALHANAFHRGATLMRCFAAFTARLRRVRAAQCARGAADALAARTALLLAAQAYLRWSVFVERRGGSAETMHVAAGLRGEMATLETQLRGTVVSRAAAVAAVGRAADNTLRRRLFHHLATRVQVRHTRAVGARGAQALLGRAALRVLQRAYGCLQRHMLHRQAAQAAHTHEVLRTSLAERDAECSRRDQQLAACSTEQLDIQGQLAAEAGRAQRLEASLATQAEALQQGEQAAAALRKEVSEAQQGRAAAELAARRAEGEVRECQSVLAAKSEACCEYMRDIEQHVVARKESACSATEMKLRINALEEVAAQHAQVSQRLQDTEGEKRCVEVRTAALGAELRAAHDEAVALQGAVECLTAEREAALCAQRLATEEAAGDAAAALARARCLECAALHRHAEASLAARSFWKLRLFSRLQLQGRAQRAARAGVRGALAGVLLARNNDAVMHAAFARFRMRVRDAGHMRDMEASTQREAAQHTRASALEARLEQHVKDKMLRLLRDTNHKHLLAAYYEKLVAFKKRQAVRARRMHRLAVGFECRSSAAVMVRYFALLRRAVQVSRRRAQQRQSAHLLASRTDREEAVRVFAAWCITSLVGARGKSEVQGAAQAATLRSELETQAQRAKQQLQEDTGELRGELQEVQNRLQDAEQLASAQRQDLAQGADTLRQCEADLRTATAREQALQLERDSLAAEVESLTKRLKKYQGACDEARGDASAAREERVSLERAMRTENAELHTKTQDLDAQLATAKEQLAAVDAKYTSAVREAAGLQEELATSERAHQQQLSEKARLLGEAAHTTTELEARIAGMETVAASDTKEHARILERCERLEQRARDTEQQLDTTTEESAAEVKQLAARVAELTAEATSVKLANSTLLAQEASLQESTRATAAAATATQGELRCAQEELAAARQELSTLQDTHAQAALASTTLETELRHELQQRDAHTSSLRSEVKALSEARQHSDEEHDTATLQLQADVAQLRDERHSLQASLAESAEAHTAAAAEAGALRAELSAAKSQAESFAAEAETRGAEMSQLHQHGGRFGESVRCNTAAMEGAVSELEAALHEALSRAVALEAALEAAERDNASLSLQAAELLREGETSAQLVAKLRSAAAAGDETRSRLEEELHAAKTQKAGLLASLDVADSRLADSRTQLAAATGRAEGLAEETAALQCRLDTAEAALRSNAAAQQAAERQGTALTQAAAAAEAGLDAAREDHLQQQQQHDCCMLELRSALSTAQAEADSQATGKRKAVQKAATLQESLATATQQAAALRQDRGLAEAAFDEERKTLKERIATLQQTCQEAGVECTVLRRRTAEAEATAADHKRQEADLAGRLQAARRESATLEERLLSLLQGKSDAIAREAALAETVRQLEQSVATLTPSTPSVAAAAGFAAAELQDENFALRQQLEEAHAKLSRVERQLSEDREYAHDEFDMLSSSSAFPTVRENRMHDTLTEEEVQLLSEENELLRQRVKDLEDDVVSPRICPMDMFSQPSPNRRGTSVMTAVTALILDDEPHDGDRRRVGEAGSDDASPEADPAA